MLIRLSQAYIYCFTIYKHTSLDKKNKHCQLGYFRSELLQEINGSEPSITKFEHLDDTLKTVLDKHAPL